MVAPLLSIGKKIKNLFNLRRATFHLSLWFICIFLEVWPWMLHVACPVTVYHWESLSDMAVSLNVMNEHIQFLTSLPPPSLPVCICQWCNFVSNTCNGDLAKSCIWQQKSFKSWEGKQANRERKEGTEPCSSAGTRGKSEIKLKLKLQAAVMKNERDKWATAGCWRRTNSSTSCRSVAQR